jgi:integrase
MKPYYRDRRPKRPYGEWQCQYRGTTVYLCTEKRKTRAGYYKAMATMKRKCPELLDVKMGEYNKLPLLGSCFLEHIIGNFSYKHAQDRLRQTIGNFCTRWADLQLHEVRGVHLLTWLETCVTWGPAEKRRAVGQIKRMFAWGLKQGLLLLNPLADVSVKDVAPGPRVKKGPEVCITEDEHHALLAVAGKNGKMILTAMWETGCRPKEIRTVRACHFNGSAAWVFGINEGKTKTRTIPLSPVMARMTEELVAKGRDYLFPNPIKGGHPPIVWRKGHVHWEIHGQTGTRLFGDFFQGLCRKAGIKRPGLTPYSYRHAFINTALDRGIAIDDVADIVGNSPATIRDHYEHRVVNKNLLDSLEKIRGA